MRNNIRESEWLVSVKCYLPIILVFAVKLDNFLFTASRENKTRFHVCVESQSTWNHIILNLFVFCFLTNHYCQTKKHEALYTHFLPKKVIDSSFSAVSVPMILLSD